MPAASSGRLEGLKKPRGRTLSTNKHRFESFNQRVAKLKIDPIRRSRRTEGQHDDTISTSFFATGLDRWKTLNLSENFSNFVREVEPFCESLPQILHHQQNIMDILARYIEKADVLSLEPILSLLAHFAHDLGSRFEVNMSTALKMVSMLAAKHTAIEVVEWSFECLAWLFKYLSRLIVPDIRPLFDIMAPLLGRETQRPHTTRFAAEALSFLVRKAALTYHRNQTPLSAIIEHLLKDLETLEDEKQVKHYQHGLMSLLANTIKGVDRGLHSCGINAYKCMLNAVICRDDGRCERSVAIIYGVTTNLIHHTDANTFKPISDALVQHIATMSAQSGTREIVTCARLLYIMTAVRMGSRIKEWKTVFDALISSLKLSSTRNDECLRQIYKTAAVILHLCPFNIVFLQSRQVIDIVLSDSLSHHFLPLCMFVCGLDPERFHQLLSPYLSK